MHSGLVKLLKAFLAKDCKRMISAGQITFVLAVVQQRLVPSKINDAWSFGLLHSVLHSVPLWVLEERVLFTLFVFAGPS
jgi:exportin-2 (importin alpha re-exporter)